MTNALAEQQGGSTFQRVDGGMSETSVPTARRPTDLTPSEAQRLAEQYRQAAEIATAAYTRSMLLWLARFYDDWPGDF
jgi:hypothetical protein